VIRSFLEPNSCKQEYPPSYKVTECRQPVN